jgi:hypothetical protein
MNEDKCLGCAKCCHYYNGKRWLKCKYLMSNNKCKVYKFRLNMIIGQHIKGHRLKCTMRENNKVNYPGCPYNKDEWETISTNFLENKN